MYHLSSEEWETLFHQDLEQFFIRMQKYLEIQEILPLRACMDFLAAHFLYLTETKKNADIEQLLPALKSSLEQFVYMTDKKPALHTIKGRMEALVQMGEYFHRTSPDQMWFTQLNGKYHEQILRHLYLKNMDQMSRIADAINIKHSQLTPIIDHLEGNQFLHRSKEGKNVWCSLTKKGFLIGKYFHANSSIASMADLLQAIVEMFRQKANPSEFGRITHEYGDRYPELTPVIKVVQELWIEKTIYQASVPVQPKWGQVLVPTEESFYSRKQVTTQQQSQQQVFQI